MNALRRGVYTRFKQKGYPLISYISSCATYFPGTPIGDNCFVLEDNTIQPFVKIGNNVVLWSGNHIGHHSTIARRCFLYVARRSLGTLHRRRVVLLRRQRDDPGRTRYRAGQLDWNRRDGDEGHRALVGLQGDTRHAPKAGSREIDFGNVRARAG